MPEAKKRHRRMFSVSHELVEKSREAALAAVQIFNNPQVTFKSEIFIVLMNIAWTYLLHAYYRKKGIEYRYFELKGKYRHFDHTKAGAYKYWELERCLNDKNRPVDKDTHSSMTVCAQLPDICRACFRGSQYIDFEGDFGLIPCAGQCS